VLATRAAFVSLMIPLFHTLTMTPLSGILGLGHVVPFCVLAFLPRLGIEKPGVEGFRTKRRLSS